MHATWLCAELVKMVLRLGIAGRLTSEDDAAELVPSQGSSSRCTSTLPSAF